MIKVVHINTYDGNGGAGKACLRLHHALNDHTSVDSKVLVFYAFGKHAMVYNYAAKWWRKLRSVFQIFYERWMVKSSVKASHIPFSLQSMGVPLHRMQLLKEADIIHLHWINHGFLNPKYLQKLQKLNKPIVWTFHDSNAFTGGCHVRYDCFNFTHHCGQCPVLKHPAKNDSTKRLADAKQIAYENLPFEVITPSYWMQKSVKMSSLLSTRKTYVIPNAINEKVFKAYVKTDIKLHLGISEDTFVILAGSAPSSKDAHKGAPYLIEALEMWSQKGTFSHKKVILVFFGNAAKSALPQLPFPTQSLGMIHDEKILAQWYAAADVFVTPSIEDNLPNTVMESLACGTPVLAFETGGIPDMVTHKINGYLAQYKDVSDLAQGLQWLYAHPNPKQLQIDARAKVLDAFSAQVVAQKHEDLYQYVIQNFKPIDD